MSFWSLDLMGQCGMGYMAKLITLRVEGLLKN